MSGVSELAVGDRIVVRRREVTIIGIWRDWHGTSTRHTPVVSWRGDDGARGEWRPKSWDAECSVFASRKATA